MRHQQEVTSVSVQHSGVQFVENDEDILLAALLLISCHKPTQDLSRVRCQMKYVKILSVLIVRYHLLFLGITENIQKYVYFR